ncbi:hypothetical protein C923_03978 [Plasmodium falciparum UGT5.1]|uniref:Uncharacterized protein n=7 Tax=Plasmodium falciparum TaxID=5833 RepID=Q8I5F8_PLAF7|nr:conserved Plasmodium protein, unknown function [Plasmodium falciparum 3D7]ETW29997.1 hypothetical protein PFFCH_02554 [Plasmodium falciparum FCH/4]ETW60291.1 hypothetical protein PFMC_03834 [Plasmodium falciparum CAMP/Malaysia]EUR67989.1 hypothetical protein PFBG_03954 [Plasmodium falciparum 7G8]EWC75380.1 hypothetical protein C923_03978 [Plasmodium falciparum UGT5.1]EWC87402.1 hypothetical protein PFNF54_03813 [Plasmodium falciparum NF54]KNG76699.1 hypothetical protein PFMG_02772 [Plasmod|eukprot:XP_001350656.1 conserved Plasmodium protein, unknown function [Plasmodium falciparum 3D7]
MIIKKRKKKNSRNTYYIYILFILCVIQIKILLSKEGSYGNLQNLKIQANNKVKSRCMLKKSHVDNSKYAFFFHNVKRNKKKNVCKLYFVNNNYKNNYNNNHNNVMRIKKNPRKGKTINKNIEENNCIYNLFGKKNIIKDDVTEVINNSNKSVNNMDNNYSNNNYSNNNYSNNNNNDIIKKSSELIKHLNFKFDEECNDIMIRIGNFLEVSPHLLFKDVCVNLNKLFTNLYTNDNANIPFGSTEHTLNVNDDVIKLNKFKIYCVLGLKVLRTFLIKYLRSIKLCIPVEVRKRYIYDFLKVEYISKAYQEKYNLIDYKIFSNISEKLKTKLIYMYLSLNPRDVPNVLINIFKAANYNDEKELLYNYIKSSKFTSRGGKRFARIINKEYITLYDKKKLIKKHSCEQDILWMRFFSLIKEHNNEIINKTKILRQTYRLVFSKINFFDENIVNLFKKKGFEIFDENISKNLNINKYIKLSTNHDNIQNHNNFTTKDKLIIGHYRKLSILNYIQNLKNFILDYIQKKQSLHHNFYLLKKNINLPKNIYYDDTISKNTNLYHFTNINKDEQQEGVVNNTEQNLTNLDYHNKDKENVNKINNNNNNNNKKKYDHDNNINHSNVIITPNSIQPEKTQHHKIQQSNNISLKKNETNKLSQTDINLYCDNIINNTIDTILDIMMQNSGFKNVKTVMGIYTSLLNNKDLKLIDFKNKF